MQYRELGHGLKVSAIGVGCMPMIKGGNITYGEAADPDEAVKTIHRAIDLGINFFDTAQIYGPFQNEELVGQAIKGRSDGLIIASKFGFKFDGRNIVGVDGSAMNAKTAVEGTLKRLGIDCLDLYYQHRVDPNVPIEETVGAMADLITEGKIKHIGLSEAGPETLRRAAAVAPISALQSEYSLWERDIGGWKVGRINPPRDALLGADRLVGPAFRDAIAMAGDGGFPFPVFHGGFAAAEAEFMLRLAPQGGPLPATPAEAMGWIDEIRIGIEIASSPYARINADGPCVTISDHGNNAGLLLGPTVPRAHWEQLDAVEVTLAIDGQEVGRATTATMLDGPFGAARFLIENLARRGFALEPGWWISSGAITGVHDVAPGSTVIAGFAGLGTVEALIR
jgi:2-keto-4-pentenoate hydratase